MTLVIALKWLMGSSEAIIMASDSRVSIGRLTYEMRKIYPIMVKSGEENIPLAIAGGAGDTSLVKKGFRTSEKVLHEYAKKKWRGKTPDFEEFEEAINDIELRLIQMLRDLRNANIEYGFQMILGSIDPGGKASLYLFDNRGLVEPVHDNPGFAIIGSGSLAGILLLKLLGYKPETSTEIHLGVLTGFIIDLVSEVDITVGPFLGESWLMREEKGKILLGPLREEAYKEFKEEIEYRRDLFKYIWRACDELGRDTLRERLRELLKPISEKAVRENEIV